MAANNSLIGEVKCLRLKTSTTEKAKMSDILEDILQAALAAALLAAAQAAAAALKGD